MAVVLPKVPEELLTPELRERIEASKEARTQMALDMLGTAIDPSRAVVAMSKQKALFQVMRALSKDVMERAKTYVDWRRKGFIDEPTYGRRVKEQLGKVGEILQEAADVDPRWYENIERVRTVPYQAGKESTHFGLFSTKQPNLLGGITEYPITFDPDLAGYIQLTRPISKGDIPHELIHGAQWKTFGKRDIADIMKPVLEARGEVWRRLSGTGYQGFPHSIDPVELHAIRGTSERILEAGRSPEFEFLRTLKPSLQKFEYLAPGIFQQTGLEQTLRVLKDLP